MMTRKPATRNNRLSSVPLSGLNSLTGIPLRVQSPYLPPSANWPQHNENSAEDSSNIGDNCAKHKPA